MATFLLVLLGGVGITHIIIDGTIMKRFRLWAADYPALKDLTECHQCCGFWVGLAAGLMGFATLNPFTLLLSAGAVSFGAMFGRTVMDYMINNTVFEYESEGIENG